MVAEGIKAPALEDELVLDAVEHATKKAQSISKANNEFFI